MKRERTVEARILRRGVKLQFPANPYDHDVRPATLTIGPGARVNVLRGRGYDALVAECALMGLDGMSGRSGGLVSIRFGVSERDLEPLPMERRKKAT